MSKLQTPFRYDFVGSFLRPQTLKDAKTAYQAGEISKEQFDKVADEEIAEEVWKQEFAAGKTDAPEERRHPIFVALERGLDVSMEANIQPTEIESQIQTIGSLLKCLFILTNYFSKCNIFTKYQRYDKMYKQENKGIYPQIFYWNPAQSDFKNGGKKQ